MRVIIQRVRKASVSTKDNEVSSIGKGIMILLGIEHEDTLDDVKWLCGKVARLRIFDDENDIMNLSISDINGEALVVSQFTLHASTKKGNRPSYIRAARPDIAIPLYEEFVKSLSEYIGSQVKTGEFGAMMDISLINQGPVTILIDSKIRE
jgi:D-tyrosyl-tRNA(Tyr) deacylase